jgi:hypothetical protein
MPGEPYTARHRPARIHAVRPYRPVVFNKLARSRFERQRWGELTRHLGRSPSFPERILITRIISVEWWLLKIDAKLDRGEELTGFDIRGRLAAENRLRLDLQAFGLQPPKAPAPSLVKQLLADRESAA